jgi:hypothetical protein
MIPHTYLIPASRTQTVPFRNRLPGQQEKELDHGFNTQIPSLYSYGENAPSISGIFAILVVWWGREQ